MQTASGKNGEVISNVQGSCVHTSPVELGAVISPRIGLELGPGTYLGKTSSPVGAWALRFLLYFTDQDYVKTFP